MYKAAAELDKGCERIYIELSNINTSNIRVRAMILWSEYTVHVAFPEVNIDLIDEPQPHKQQLNQSLTFMMFEKYISH